MYSVECGVISSITYENSAPVSNSKCGEVRYLHYTFVYRRFEIGVIKTNE